MTISNLTRFADFRPFLLIIICFQMASCKKYLDEKPVKSMVTPNTLADLQSILDNHGVMNEQSAPGILETIADDYYVLSEDWNSADQRERENYIWQADTYYDNAWNFPYQLPVYYSNVVLDRLPEIKPTAAEKNSYNAIKGAALFFRSVAFYHLAQLYAKPFSTTAQSDPGIVLKTSSAVLDKSKRATVEQTYAKIIEDLTEAATLLPEAVTYPTRPNKATAFGALARVYLSMREYSNAARFADSSLVRNSKLMDFNDLDISAYGAIPRFNNETVFYSYLTFLTLTDPAYAKVDTVLYSLYEANDLRKDIYFYENPDGSHSYKGSYDGTLYFGTLFNGITTDEMMLIQAETAARSGKKDEAMRVLNKLLAKRYVNGTFQDLSAGSDAEALAIILKERRKELVFRGLRWTDVRRLNLENAKITLKRVVNGVTYTLPPNDTRFVMLIPPKVIDLSGIQQNPR